MPTINPVIIKYLKYILLASVLYVPLFLYLDKMSIRTFDESRNAMNAFEMFKNGNFLVTYFDGKPDMWNTKPPLLAWLHNISFHIFGFNEWAIRIPSALAAVGTCFALVFFSERYLKTFWFGFIAVIILVTMNGYSGYHVARTGDYDALLTLFTLLSGLSLFAFIENKKNKYLYLFFLFLALGCLTKGVAGLLFGPAYLLYILYKKEFLNVLKNKHFYYGIAAFLFVVGGFYALRELYNPGYLEAVWANELGGRYADDMLKKRPFGFYYERFRDLDLAYWFLWIPIGIVASLLTKNTKLKNITSFSTIMVLSHFLIISSSKNKLHWYAAPEFPFLAIIIGCIVYLIFSHLQQLKLERKSILVKLVPFMFLLILFFNPYQDIFKNVKRSLNWDTKMEKPHEMSYFLRDAINGKHDLNGYGVLHFGYRPERNFYIMVLQEKGIDITNKNWKQLEPGDKVITFQKKIKNYLNENYKLEVLGKSKNIVKYKINDRKK